MPEEGRRRCHLRSVALIQLLRGVCQAGLDVLQRQMVESFQHVAEVRVVRQVLEDSLSGNSGAFDHRLTDHNGRIPTDSVFLNLLGMATSDAEYHSP